MHKIIPLLAVSVLSSINGGVATPYDDRAIGLSFKSNTSKRSSKTPISLGKSISSKFSAPMISFSQIFTSSSTVSSSSSSATSSMFSSSPNLNSTHTPSSSASSSSINNTNRDYFSCPRYGPFSLNDPYDIEVTFTYEFYSIQSQTISERVRLFKDDDLVYGSSKGSFSYTMGQRKNVTFSIPVRDFWTSSGLELRFEILNSSRKVIKEYSSAFYPPYNGQVSASTLKNDIYTSNSLGFYGDGIEMCEFKEIFDFRPIGDYIDNDYYYRLDIAKNYFYYPNAFSLPYKSAKLRFNDSDNLFSYYTHQSNGDIEIPLYLFVSGDHISFGFNKQFYVNKRTLEISDTYQSGWMSTPYFYLPVNGLKRFNNRTLYFELNELGYNKISTVIPLKYDLNHTMVGVCTDGEYCVVGGNH